MAKLFAPAPALAPSRSPDESWLVRHGHSSHHSPCVSALAGSRHGRSLKRLAIGGKPAADPTRRGRAWPKPASAVQKYDPAANECHCSCSRYWVSVAHYTSPATSPHLRVPSRLG